MHTARLLTVSPSMHCAGGCLVPGGAWSGGVSARTGPRGHGIPAFTEADTPLWTEWRTDRCKNITFANFVCGRTQTEAHGEHTDVTVEAGTVCIADTSRTLCVGFTLWMFCDLSGSIVMTILWQKPIQATYTEYISTLYMKYYTVIQMMQNSLCRFYVVNVLWFIW